MCHYVNRKAPKPTQTIAWKTVWQEDDGVLTGESFGFKYEVGKTYKKWWGWIPIYRRFRMFDRYGDSAEGFYVYLNKPTLSGLSLHSLRVIVEIEVDPKDCLTVDIHGETATYRRIKVGRVLKDAA